MHDLHDVETRVTDSETGGQKGSKLTQVGALDPVALIELARVAGMGAQKYAAFNYLKGFDWSLAYNAAMRHAMLFWAGEDIDPESGLSHAAHAAWMLLALVSFQRRALGTDDRPPGFPSRVVQVNVRGGGCGNRDADGYCSSCYAKADERCLELSRVRVCRGCGAAEAAYHRVGCPERTAYVDPYVELGGEG